MAASEAVLGYGIVVSHESATPGTYTPIAEITAVTPPGGEADEVEVTHMTSPDRRKEFIGAMIDSGEVSGSMNLIIGTYEDMMDLVGVDKNYRIVFPDEDATTLTFPGFLKAYTPDEATPNEKLSASFTIRVGGAVTVSTTP